MKDELNTLETLVLVCNQIIQMGATIDAVNRQLFHAIEKDELIGRLYDKNDKFSKEVIDKLVEIANEIAMFKNGTDLISELDVSLSDPAMKYLNNLPYKI